jgi:HlyD family secretion protein
MRRMHGPMIKRRLLSIIVLGGWSLVVGPAVLQLARDNAEARNEARADLNRAVEYLRKGLTMVRGAALVLLALLAGCGEAPNEAWQGYVEGEFILLASPYAGQLQKLHVKRGEAVDAGKPLFALEQQNEQAARLEAEEHLKTAQARLENLRIRRRAPEIEALRAELQHAQATRALSETTLAREEKLVLVGATSRARYDQAQSALERDKARVLAAEAQLNTALQPVGRRPERKAAEAEVAAARAAAAQAAWRQEQKSVSAPVSGVVQDTFFVEGEWVPAGRPVAALLPPGNVKARFYVPETALAGLALGSAIEILCDGCAPLPAKVSFISRQAEYTPPVLYSKESRGKLLFLVEARPDPPASARLHPGQPIDVRRK